MYHKKNIVGLT